MGNTGESLISLGSGEGECAGVKKPKMRLERKRTREEEQKMLSDLSALQNLAAMLEAEKFMKRKKRKRTKKKRKADIDVASQEIDTVDAADEDKANTVAAVEATESAETKPVEISEKYALEKVDAAYETDANAVMGVATTGSFETCLMKQSEESLLEKVDAAYENMAKTVIDVETAALFRTRPEAKSVLAKADAAYENKAKTDIDLETTDSFRTGSVAKSVLEKVDAGCENKAKAVISEEKADSFETRPAEKSVLEKVDAADEENSNSVLAVETADSFETKPVEISEKYILEKVDATYENKANTVINVEPAESLQTSPLEKSEGLSLTNDEEMGLQKAKRPCQKNEVMCSLDEFKIISDLSNFKNLAAMMKAEAIVSQKKIERRRKKKRRIELEAQDELSVQKVKAGVQADEIKVVEMRKASETESVSVTKSFPTEELLEEAKKNCKENEEVMSYLDEFKMISDLSNSKNLAAMMEAEAFMRCKNRKKRRKKNRGIDFEVPLQIIANGMKEQKLVDACKSVDTVKLFAVKDSIVQQRLHRAPRYFETPESSWRMCDNCRKGCHTAVCCSADSQKPCCLCGSFKHSADHCNQAPKCFVYERSKHAKGSPEKNQGKCSSSMICLRCGGSGHDMFSCRNEYSSDDLKEIQCYVCKGFGHLCCVNFPEIL